jgi:hypothetical protein
MFRPLVKTTLCALLVWIPGAYAKDLGGVLIAAPGQSSVVGAQIEICPWDGRTARCEAYQPIVIRQGGVFATFKMTGLPDGEYRVIAYRDLNRSGGMDAGDEAALFSNYPYQDPANVRPGRLDVALRLIPYSGNPVELLPEGRADKERFEGVIGVAPSALVGRWGGTGAIADNYNTVTGAYVATTWSASGIEFRANGTYESANLFQGTSRCMVYVDKGRYSVSGATLRLTATRLEQFECGRANSTTRSGTLGSTDHWWRFYYYAGSGLKLQIIAKSKLRDERDWYYATDYSVAAR